MAVPIKAPQTGAKKPAPAKVEQAAEKEAKSFKAFFTKFNNDWVMNFAAGLAFNLLTAIFPIAIAIIGVAGFVIGNLDPAGKANLINGLTHIFPSSIQSGNTNVIEIALTSLQKDAWFLTVIAVLTALFGGSRLFVTIEGYFDIIYHTRPRNVIPQNIMAFGMLILFIVLTPILVFAASLPAFLLSLLQNTPLGQIPGFGLLGILGSLFVSWILFLAIYIVVPNQRIRFRNSWLGALIAAVLLQIFLALFPFYVSHFLGNYSGQAGFAVILLFFFYYFAVILLLGAEVNAFYLEGIHATPDNIAVMVHSITSHLATSKKDVREQAAASHKDEEPKDIRPQSQAQRLEEQARSSGTKTALVEHGPEDQEPAHPPPAYHLNGSKKAPKKRSPMVGTAVEAVAGTGLAFLVQFFNLRHKK